MSDLDLLREMRTEISTPTPARLASGRTQLLASVSQPTRPRRRRVFLSTGVVAAAAAVVVTAIVVAVSGSPGTKAPSTVSSAVAAPTTRLTLAGDMLTNAAGTMASRPAAQLHPSQWIYAKSISFTFGRGTTTDEYWIRFDGTRSAYLHNGKLVLHKAPKPSAGSGTALDRYDANATLLTARDALASLPPRPGPLLAMVDKHIAGMDPGQFWFSVRRAKDNGQREFEYLSQLLWNAYAGASPAAVASVYRAIATIGDISIQNGITNLAGHPAIGVSADGGETQLLLDPHSYQVIGIRTVSIGASPTGDKGTWPKKGTVASALARSQVAEVSGAGRR